MKSRQNASGTPWWIATSCISRAKLWASGRNSSTESPGCTSPSIATTDSVMAVKLRCVSTQALGSPVVPDVYR